MKAPLKAAVLLLLASSPGFAHKQNNKTQVRPMPNTPDQVGQLGYYIGTWEGHGETKGGPFGKAGKLSSKQTCKWFAGRHHVICRGEEMGPTGQRQFLNILAYDENAHAYTEYSVSSRGEAEYDTGGSLVGGKLTFIVEQDAGGKPAKFQVSETHVSPTLYTYTAQVSVAGGPWAELGEGKIRKVRASSR
jgi:uncharacterized protein DUF1579